MYYTRPFCGSMQVRIIAAEGSAFQFGSHWGRPESFGRTVGLIPHGGIIEHSYTPEPEVESVPENAPENENAIPSEEVSDAGENLSPSEDVSDADAGSDVNESGFDEEETSGEVPDMSKDDGETTSSEPIPEAVESTTSGESGANGGDISTNSHESEKDLSDLSDNGGDRVLETPSSDIEE